jgi:hypothetical protein
LGAAKTGWRKVGFGVAAVVAALNFTRNWAAAAVEGPKGAT